jgi:actin-related protein 9
MMQCLSRKHVLFNQLQLRRVQNESPVILTLPSNLSRPDLERTCQIFFERFNVAGFSILERPLAQLFAANVSTGVVIDIGYESTDITPINESFLVRNACQATTVGLRDCQDYLAHALRTNNALMNILSPPESPLSPADLQATLLELAKFLWENNHVKLSAIGDLLPVEDDGVTDIAAIVVAGKEKAVIESGQKKKQNAKASAAEQSRIREMEALDLISVEWKGLTLTLGKERHRLCDPLFNPSVLTSIPPGNRSPSRGPSLDKAPLALQEAVGLAISQVEPDYRQYVCQGLFVTGDLTRYVKGICQRVCQVVII